MGVRARLIYERIRADKSDLKSLSLSQIELRIYMNKILSVLFFNVVFAWWSSLTIGLSSDEYFHILIALQDINF